MKEDVSKTLFIAKKLYKNCGLFCRYAMIATVNRSLSKSICRCKKKKLCLNEVQLHQTYNHIGCEPEMSLGLK